MTSPFSASASIGASASASLSVSASASLVAVSRPPGPSAPTSPPPPFTYPVHTFRFHVHFMLDTLDGAEGSAHPLCGGAFAECTGIEATMEPKVIKEGGRNYGAAQRAGPVTFATIVLKRGITSTTDLWTWFDMLTNQHMFKYRLAATINVYDHAGKAVMAWHLAHAMPVKFKGADLNARGAEVGVEELHLAHEGLTLTAASHPTIEDALR